MSRLICVAGETGSGKTTSFRNLDPKTTFYIDADQKGLSWRGWKKQYNVEAKNYYRGSNIHQIRTLLSKVDRDQSHIKVVIVDTINAMMIDDEFSRMKEKGYDKWADMASGVYGLITDALRMREDLTIVFVAHTQTERDDSGYVFTRVKTSGRKLDKIVLESKFTTVLLAKCIDGQHVFEAHANNSTAKSPMGLFDSNEIPNDMVAVIAAMDKYESEE